MNNPVTPGSDRWRELVQQGIVKDGQRNWFLGDAALEIAPMGEGQANNGAFANLARYADEVGIDAGSLRIYRQVAAAWPHENRVSCAWKVHQQLMSRKDLIKPGMTVTQAAAALGHSNVGRTGPRADVQSRAAAVRDYLADPEVAREVVSDPDTARDIVSAAPASIAKASIEHHQRVRDQVAPPGSHERKVRDGFARRYQVQTVLQRLAELRLAVGQLAELGSLEPVEMDDLAESAQRTLPSLTWLAELSPDQADISDQVADWLRSQS